MKREELNNETLSAFIVRQSSSAFLCRHRNCSRAAQGFRTLELREKHEESHRPRFQCAHALCGFFGATYDSQAAMKKHAAQYHDEEATASIPNSLTRRPHGVHEDRSLFAFTEVKTRPRVEDFSPREKFEMATDVSPKYSQTTLASSVSRHAAAEGVRKTPITPSNATKSAFSDLVQVANASRSEASWASPAINVSQQPSPFVEGSPFGKKETNTYPSFSTDHLRPTSTTPLERHPEQRDSEGNTHVFVPPQTLRPEDMFIHYDDTEEDTTTLYDSAPPIHPSSITDFSSESLSLPQYGQYLGSSLENDVSHYQEWPLSPLPVPITGAHVSSIEYGHDWAAWDGLFAGPFEDENKSREGGAARPVADIGLNTEAEIPRPFEETLKDH